MFQGIIDKFDAIFDWFGDQFAALFEFLISLLMWFWTPFRQFFRDVWAWAYDKARDGWDVVIAYLADFWAWAWPRLREYLRQFRDWIESKAQEAGIDYTFDDLGQGLNTLADVYADAAWILPLNEVMAIVLATLLGAATIRLGRWILSFFWWTG
ncbi:MAG: hypothetical protein AAF333_07500 [Planctomycetota bacterium]